MIVTIEAQVGVTEGGVHEGTVMREGRIDMEMGAEVAAGYAHPLDRNRAGLLKLTDQVKKRAQQAGPFRLRQRVECGLKVRGG